MALTEKLAARFDATAAIAVADPDPDLGKFSLTPKEQECVSTHVSRHIKEYGYERDRAIAAAIRE